MNRVALATVVFMATVVFSGCATTGSVETRYPNGTVSTLTFRKGVFDDLDVPAQDPATGLPTAYVRVGTSRVAAETALKGFQYSGDALRQYMIDRAAQNEQAEPKKY